MMSNRRRRGVQHTDRMLGDDIVTEDMKTNSSVGVSHAILVQPYTLRAHSFTSCICYGIITFEDLGFFPDEFLC
jgi:hypothetical protein